MISHVRHPHYNSHLTVYYPFDLIMHFHIQNNAKKVATISRLIISMQQSADEYKLLPVFAIHVLS